jgi:hypothetical protein
MIRPVPYVDLPGIVYALDRRARTRQSEFANFVIAPAAQESRSTLAAFLSATQIIKPHAYTWICEDRWRLLGVAQARPRPGGEAWDMTYLAAMSSPDEQPSSALGVSGDDVLLELAQFALNAAIMRGVHRFFARVGDDRREMELFGKLGFQRYARELTYWLPSASAGLDQLASRGGATDDEADSVHEVDGVGVGVPLRRWHRHDAWGLLRLADAATPHRVRIAESLTSDEFLYARTGSGRMDGLPLIEPPSVAYVCDRGVRLGGWIRLRLGRGSLPHQLWLLAHPDEPGVALALLRFGLRLLAREEPRPLICQAREYETATGDALCAAGFEHAATHALLVRHLTMRALRRNEVAAVEPRVVYGVKGWGNAPTRLSEGELTHYATHHHH